VTDQEFFPFFRAGLEGTDLNVSMFGPLRTTNTFSEGTPPPFTA
jgi:hypothetical protein